MTQRAKTIAEAYRACNPEKPLSAQDDRYVDLSESRGVQHIAELITWRIENSEPGMQVKQLFTGHRGSGKTTELLRLQQELEKSRFFTIYIDVEELLDLGSLSYLDVLMAMAKEVEAELARKEMPLSAELLNSIAQWFSDRIIEETKSREMAGSISTKATAGSEIPLFAKFFASTMASVKAGSSQRETIRTALKRELSVFMDRLNLLIDTAREKVKDNGCQDIVLIVDGMEKMHYELNSDGVSTHTDLFIRHAEQLRAPQCHIIYTVPVSLAYDQNLITDFDDIEILPMVRTDSKGIATLIELVEQRMDTQLIFSDPDLLERLVRTSGGVVRELMHLIRMSLETRSEQISAADVDRAISNLRKLYARLIRESDIDYFRRIQRNHHIQVGDEEAGRLLHQRLVLEYQNGDLWADLHPIVTQIPWVKKALADVTDDGA